MKWLVCAPWSQHLLLHSTTWSQQLIRGIVYHSSPDLIGLCEANIWLNF